ncbi:MAG: TraB/GumN family protein [Bacteroidales bacterium]|nr:TraB/GumN family protein [Bacteroidales bacterium]
MHLNKNILLTLCIAMLAVTTAFSQSLMWKVSGKSLKNPSYLYGTIHIQDQRVFDFDSTVYRAFASCEAFAMEVLMDELDMKQVQESMYLPKGKTLSGILPKEDFARLDSFCKARIGTSVIFLNTMKPVFLSSALEQAAMPTDQETALDLYFLQQARSQGKLCFGVENYADQIKALDALPLDQQIDMLMKVVDEPADESEKMYDSLLQAYLAFDFDEMMRFFADTSLPGEFSTMLLDKRNMVMLKKFVSLSKAHTLFCAVGAAHLGGDKGLIAMLRKKGYSVEPVIFEWKKKK